MATTIARMGTASTARLDPTDEERITRKWAQEVKGWKGAAGGWIYNGRGVAICQGWGSVWHQHKTEILDWLTDRLTAFTSFHEMCRETEETYCPTIRAAGRHAADYRALADAYDTAQEYYGSRQRACRGQGYERYAVARSGEWHRGWVILDTVANTVALGYAGGREYVADSQIQAQKDTEAMNRQNAHGRRPVRSFGPNTSGARVA